MDYCSAESELIESLDYLTLPVKRSNSFAKVGYMYGEHPTRPRLVGDYTKKVSHKTQTTHSLHKFNDSIILNSTKEEIIEYYAFVSPSENTPSSKFLEYLLSEEIANQIKDKSLIKVTVAPKITKPHKPNIFTSRKQNNKNIHNSASDEEHFLQARNVYLVVSEQKRERHYNIKTTESAKLLNNNNKTNDDISLEQLKDVKQIIHSLNMDKKRKKGGPVPVSKEKRRMGSPAKTKVSAKKEGKKSKADNEDKTKEDSDQTKQTTGLVRITTQVGLDHNNQLQMRCGVEGRKGSHLAPANVEFKSYPDPYFPNTETLLHTVNQGTQIEMADIHNNKVPHYSEGVACFCTAMKDLNKFDNSLETQHQTEGHQSPLVVITVYPNNERCESVKIYKRCGRSSPSNTYEGYTDVNVLQETNHYSTEDKNDFHGIDTEFPDNSGGRKSRTKSVSKILRETEIVNRRHNDRPSSLLRSTSSSENKIKRQETKTNDTIKPAPKAKSNNFSRSPRNQSPNKNSVKNIKQKGSDKNILRKNKNEIKKIKESLKSPSPRSQSQRSLSPSSRSPSAHSDRNMKRKNNENQRKKETELKRQDLKKQAMYENFTKPINLTSMGTNTDHTWTKKALVDAFTKEVLGQMEKKKKDRNPRENESQVAISINGDNENYDVLFQQARRTTNVRVRKTVKRSSAERSYHPNDMKGETSMANLLEDQNMRNYERDETVVPEIKVRDSLEIGHKRQQSSRISLVSMDFPALQTNLSDADSFAPIKHYTGDNCPIPNPVKRDKEIRQLLGIEKQSKSRPPFSHLENPGRGGPCKHHQAELRNKKELKKQNLETHKSTHHINFQVSPNKKSVGAQYELQNVADSPSAKKMILNRNIQVFLQIEKFTEQKPIVLSRKQYLKVKRAIESTTFKRSKHKLMKVKCSAGAFIDAKKKEKIVTDTINQTEDRINHSDRLNPMFAYKDKPVLFTTEFKKKKEPSRQSGGSGDERMSYSEHINESSTKVTVGSAYSHSIHTIFRGFKKSHTPNFGTSTCSLYSGNSNEFYETSAKYFNTLLEKPKKPFLRRLMSCLVLRASTASGVKIAVPPKPKPSCNSCTVDSYLINTSLAALEMSSSIYDTSESFYSNHSILPINNKIKRSFLGSVRGLLSYGKN